MRNTRIAKKKLDAIAKKIGYRKIHYLVLSRMLNKEFKSLKTNFRFQRAVARGSFFTAAGSYSPPNTSDSPHRYTVYICRDGRIKYVKPRKAFFRDVYFVLAHEYGHGYQHRTRKFRNRYEKKQSFRHKNKKTQEMVRYLSDYDEIDAYAFEAAEAAKMGESTYTVRQYDEIKEYAPKAWKRFHKKVYLFTHK